jgi:flagellin FlaB
MKTIIKNENAQAGVGTLIIFIAMVLVAAVAAAVLIQTSGVMQSKSTATTKEAAAAIGENLALESVDGYRNTSVASLQFLNITVKVAAGGSDIDLTKVLLKVNGINYNFTSNITSSPANTFWIYSLREATTGATDIAYSGTNSYATTTASTLKPGALARVDVNVSGLSPALSARSTITLAMTPEKGATLNMQLTTPALGSSNIVAIYP